MCLIRRCPPEFSCEARPRVWDCMHSRVSLCSASLSRGNCINGTLIFFFFFFAPREDGGAIATNQNPCGYFTNAHTGAVVITTCSNYSICSAADRLSAVSWLVEPRNQLDDRTEETKTTHVRLLCLLFSTFTYNYTKTHFNLLISFRCTSQTLSAHGCVTRWTPSPTPH